MEEPIRKSSRRRTIVCAECILQFALPSASRHDLNSTEMIHLWTIWQLHTLRIYVVTVTSKRQFCPLSLLDQWQAASATCKEGLECWQRSLWCLYLHGQCVLAAMQAEKLSRHTLVTSSNAMQQLPRSCLDVSQDSRWSSWHNSDIMVAKLFTSHSTQGKDSN